MEHHLNIQKCLRAFAVIIANGERQQDDSHFLDGMVAQTLDDGYTVIMKNNDSQLTIYFHNKFALESPNQQSKDAFIKQLYRIAEQ